MGQCYILFVIISNIFIGQRCAGTIVPHLTFYYLTAENYKPIKLNFSVKIYSILGHYCGLCGLPNFCFFIIFHMYNYYSDEDNTMNTININFHVT